MSVKFTSFMNNEAKIDELVMERSAWMHASKDFRDRTIKMIARKMSSIHKNNPFIYNQVMSKLKNNIDTPEDYYKQIK